MKMILSVFWAFLITSTLGVGISWGDESLETNQFTEVLQKIKTKSVQYGSKKVLVVIDIDNTLLALNQNFGSDQWMDWQTSLLKTKSPQLVAPDFNGLLLVQQKLFSLSGMHLTDPAIPEVLTELKNMNIEVLVLSARGSEMLSSTIREFNRNGLSFFPHEGYQTSAYLPYDLKKPEQSCLTEKEIELAKLGEPRMMSVANNVVHSSGQHKGIILKTILCLRKKDFESIVFIDDKQKNVDHMKAIFEPLVDLVTYRFTSEDQNVAAFQKSDKSEESAQWIKLRDTLSPIFK